jgi:hypothetical protein
MMRDYTYEDMLKMQQEAAIRVREMKKRAAITADEDEPMTKTGRQSSDDGRHFSYPVEMSVDENDDAIKTEQKKDSGILSFLSEDKDAMLVLSLIVILAGEHSDYLTTLSLIYLLL